MRGATEGRKLINPVTGISIHAPHAGRDLRLRSIGTQSLNFNPRAPCGARLKLLPNFQRQRLISIHAPHAGRDTLQTAFGMTYVEFQSTRPMRGATIKSGVHVSIAHAFQSTRPMRGATITIGRSLLISAFQSTRPMRGATYSPWSEVGEFEDFNPRAPCGARPKNPRENTKQNYFNPRAPCGARPAGDAAKRDRLPFQSTRPMRGATGNLCLYCPLCHISIHAPHAGRDLLCACG